MSIPNLLPRRRTTAAYARGVEHGRGEAVEFLRTQATQHQGQVGDARRRGALNHAADLIRDRRPAGRDL